MFEQLPSNTTATEGGSAEFSCTVLSGNSTTQLNSVWGVKMPGGTEQHIVNPGDVNTLDLNVSTAFIGTPFHSPLTIANVTRSLDGIQVRCLFLRNGIPTSQVMPYAFLTVQCEFSMCTQSTTHAVILNNQLTCQHPDPNPITLILTPKLLKPVML